MTFPVSTRSVSQHVTVALALVGMVLLAVTPVSTAIFEFALVGTLAATIGVRIRRLVHLRTATVFLRLGLVLAGLRIVVVSAMSPADGSARYGITGGLGEMLAGGNAFIGTVACAIALFVLVVVSFRRHAAPDALIAGSMLALAVAAAGALVTWGPIGFDDALRAMPRACGIAVALALPAVVACASRRPSATLA